MEAQESVVYAFLKAFFGRLYENASYLVPFLRPQVKKVNWRDPVELNKIAMRDLQIALKHNPAADLRKCLPLSYDHIMDSYLRAKAQAAKDEEAKKEPPPDFREKIDQINKAEIIFPLAYNVIKLLSQYSEENEEAELLTPLKRLIWNSPKIWESIIRGVVLKCSDHIVLKLIRQPKDYTECTSMQYLAEKLPAIPIPRLYGAIRLGGCTAIFMTYTPSMTLTQAWPKLDHEAKVSIQNQLEVIFSKLRTLRQDDGHALGGVAGEGVKEARTSCFPHDKVIIDTAASFQDLQFSLSKFLSKSYIRLIQSLQPPPTTGSVFTHGDVRTDNIMVDFDDAWKVTGIIDWEDAGYYPDYYESTTLTRTFISSAENDWYNYLPPCIDPARFPHRWLIDRLWGIHHPVY